MPMMSPESRASVIHFFFQEFHESPLILSPFKSWSRICPSHDPASPFSVILIHLSPVGCVVLVIQMLFLIRTPPPPPPSPPPPRPGLCSAGKPAVRLLACRGDPPEMGAFDSFPRKLSLFLCFCYFFLFSGYVSRPLLDRLNYYALHMDCGWSYGLVIFLFLVFFFER